MQQLEEEIPSEKHYALLAAQNLLASVDITNIEIVTTQVDGMISVLTNVTPSDLMESEENEKAAEAVLALAKATMDELGGSTMEQDDNNSSDALQGEVEEEQIIDVDELGEGDHCDAAIITNEAVVSKKKAMDKEMANNVIVEVTQGKDTDITTIHNIKKKGKLNWLIRQKEAAYQAKREADLKHMNSVALSSASFITDGGSSYVDSLTGLREETVGYD